LSHFSLDFIHYWGYKPNNWYHVPIGNWGINPVKQVLLNPINLIYPVKQNNQDSKEES